MELRHIRYFVAAAEEENFHRAAERLCVVTPALSRRIHDLETELGVQLFERQQKRVRLSAMGRAFLDDARRILHDVDQAVSHMRHMAAGEIGTLHIGLNETVIRHVVVTAAFRDFRARYPGVELKLGPIPASNLVEAVLAGRVDAAFIYTRPPGDASLDHLRIETDDFFLALPAGHILARRTELRLADLKDETFLWMDRDSAPGVYDRMIAACSAGGLTPRIVQHVLSENTRLHLVSAGMGLTFVTSAFTATLPESVVTRRIADFSIPLDLELVWKKDAMPAALGRFIDTVKALKASTAEPPRLRSAG